MMLNLNDDRLDYGQLLAPSDNYKLDFAIGTTYSLDLDALVGVCIALGLSEEIDSDLMKDPICLLQALKKTGDKIALFCEGGQIYAPTKDNVLHILLEKMVFQVKTVTSKGVARFPSFHPKFWLVRYIDEQKNPLYRVIVLSRNLTFDRSWDVCFGMDGKVSGKKTLKTAPIGDFLSYLVRQLPADENAKSKQKKIKAIQKELPFVHFEIQSNEFCDFEFLPVGIKNNTGKLYSINNNLFNPLFKDSFHELLIVSPFLSESVISGFTEHYTSVNYPKYMLFTRAMSLGKLTTNIEKYKKFKIFTLKDVVVDGESVISGEDSQNLKQDIHAKIYMVRKHSDSYLFLGSLNASHNALNNNIEFMILLKSKNRYLNMKKLSEALFNGKEDNPLNPFQRVDLTNSIAVDEEEDQQSKLVSYLKEIIRLNPTAKVVSNGEFFNLAVNFPDVKLKYKVRVSPLLFDKSEALSGTICFYSLSIMQLSEFYKISVSDGEKGIERVIVIPTEGIPEDREKAIISNVVNDKNCFFKYMALVLENDYSFGAFEASSAVGSSIKNNSNPHGCLPALYEKILQIAAIDPERLKEIDWVVKSVSSDGIIPEDFIALYNTVKRAVNINE